MSVSLSIRLFGGFLFQYEDQVVDLAGHPRLQELLAYLLLHRDGLKSRQQVAFLFWPESSERQARANLRSLWYRLRALLPAADRYLYADAAQIGWRREVDVALDVAHFEDHLQKAEAAGEARYVAQIDHLQQAIEVYRGELLPDCYSEWLLLARERLHSRYLQAVDRLIGLLEEQRAYDTAIRYGELRLRQDRLHEATYRRLMRLHALNGERSRALRVYHDCVAILEQELGVAPTAATQELYARLHEAIDLPSPAKAPATPGHSSLVGRQRAWHTLLRRWRRLESGQAAPHLALISGEAGVGKTRLAEEFLLWARRQGVTTATAHCYPATQALALMPVATWLRELSLEELPATWLQEISRLLPELVIRYPELATPAPLEEPWQQLRFFRALAQAVLIQKQPLLLLLDDLQWCDEDTLRWLAYLLQPETGVRVLVVATGRSEAIRPQQLSQLSAGPGWTKLDLERLDEAQTALLAANLTGESLSPDLVHKLYLRTEGNPLFIVETIRAGLVEEALPASGEPDNVAPLPQPVWRVLASRLEDLSPAAREVVGVAATIGRSFTFPILGEASDEDETTVVAAMEELWQRRIIREQGRDAYDFTHGNLRQVAYEQLTPTRRRWLHRRVAAALLAANKEHVGEVSGQIATHYELAGQTALAIDYYLQAGEQAQRLFANERTLAGYYDRALQLLADASSPIEVKRRQRVELLEQKGRALQRIGRKPAARSAFTQALELVAVDEVIRRCRLQRLVGHTYQAEGRYASALAAFQQAESILDDPTLRTSDQWLEWIEIQEARMSVHYGQGQAETMAVVAEEVAPIMEHYGTPEQRVQFLHLRARVAFRSNRYAGSDEAYQYAQQAHAASQQVGDPATIAEGQFGLAFSQLWRGEADEAEANFLQALALSERCGAHLLQMLCLSYLATLYRLRGASDSVREYASQSLVFAEAGEWNTYAGAARANLAWLAWREGRHEEARSLAEAALADWEGSTYPFQWLALWLLVDRALARQEAGAATSYARRLLDTTQQQLPASIATAVTAAVSAAESGQSSRAMQELRRAVELAQGIGHL